MFGIQPDYEAQYNALNLKNEGFKSFKELYM